MGSGVTGPPGPGGESPNPNLDLGKAALAERDFAAAVHYFQSAIAQDSNSVEAWAWLGAAHGAAGHYQDAVNALGEAARLNPASARIQYNLGTALEALGETDRARAAYESAIRINPNYQLATEALKRLPGGVEAPPPISPPTPTPSAQPPLAPPQPGGPAPSPWGQPPLPPPIPRLGVRPEEVPGALPHYARRLASGELKPPLPGRWPFGAFLGVFCGFATITLLQLLTHRTPPGGAFTFWFAPDTFPGVSSAVYVVLMLSLVAGFAAVGGLVAHRADTTPALWLSPLCWAGSLLLTILVSFLAALRQSPMPGMGSPSLLQLLSASFAAPVALVVLMLLEFAAFFGTAVGALIAALVAVALQPRKTSTAALLGVCLGMVGGLVVYGVCYLVASTQQGSSLLNSLFPGIPPLLFGWVAAGLGIIVGLATAPAGRGFKVGLVAGGAPIAALGLTFVVLMGSVLSMMGQAAAGQPSAISTFTVSGFTAIGEVLTRVVLCIALASLYGGGVGALIYTLIGQRFAAGERPLDLEGAPGEDRPPSEA